MGDNEIPQINVRLFEDSDQNGVTPRYEGFVRDGIQEQDENLVDMHVAGSSGNFLLVKCEMVKVCHGTYTPNGAGATLIILLFHFYRGSSKVRFKSASIEMEFERGEGSQSTPQVMNIAPAATWYLDHSVQKMETTYSSTANIQGTGGPAQATLGVTGTWKRNSEKGYWVTIQGIPRTKSVSSAYNDKVRWDVWENGDTEEGIPMRLQTAVLLRREKGNKKFSASLTITGDVDAWSSIKEKAKRNLKKMSSSSYKPPSIMFNPAFSRGEVKDANNMMNENLDDYKEATSHPEEKTEKEATGTQEGSDTQKPAEKSAVLQPPLPSSKPISPPPYETTPGPSPNKLLTNNAVPPPPPLTDPAAPPPLATDPTVPAPIPVAAVTHNLNSVSGEAEHSPSTLAGLRQQLAKLRDEASWIRRLLWLEREERRIMSEIERLEG
ncbi:hypothetical protein DL98DRAFT_521303 [Cadophora sp. DSE1049]|nr:hypothetical protein DL98DRAFT_521303 [Cadophora sp. DSE1049]